MDLESALFDFLHAVTRTTGVRNGVQEVVLAAPLYSRFALAVMDDRRNIGERLPNPHSIEINYQGGHVVIRRGS